MSARTTTQRIRAELAAAECAGGELAALARRLEPLLDALESELQARGRKRGTRGVEYSVEQSEIGEALAEHRLSGKSQPFRCPRIVFDAVVELLAEREVPMSAQAISEAIAAELGQRPGDYQIRVTLRALLSADPPLVVRYRAKYTAKNAASIVNDATTFWASRRDG